MFEAQVLCLALTIFNEARGESDKGQLAVANVIINRVKQHNSSICSEVKKPKQFSFRKSKKPKNRKEWERVLHNSIIALSGNNPVGDAYYFNNDKMRFGKFTKKIGKHYFYSK